MIARYWSKEMRALWDGSLRKFQYWLHVELTTLTIREKMGYIPRNTTARVTLKTYIDEDVQNAITRRDKAIGHDLNAFVEIMRLQIQLNKETSWRLSPRQTTMNSTTR